MDKSITIAKSILSNMFGISSVHFETHSSRKFKVNEARRFLVYYLVKVCKIKYVHVVNYVPSLKNHATAIHHCRKMQDMLSLEPRSQRLWLSFCEKMETEGQDHLIQDYEKVTNHILELKMKLQNLKQMINEA